MGNKTIVIGICILLFVVLPTIFFVNNYINKSITVVTKEIDPAIIQQKYVWFQDHKGAIDNAAANIENQIVAARLKKSDQNRSEWDRTDKQMYSRSIDDIVGIIAMRNGLVRDYNVAMSEWQMEFANLGSWPVGAKYSQTDFRNFPNSYPEYSYGEEMKGL